MRLGKAIKYIAFDQGKSDRQIAAEIGLTPSTLLEGVGGEACEREDADEASDVADERRSGGCRDREARGALAGGRARR
jgi:hypothetical protein